MKRTGGGIGVTRYIVNSGGFLSEYFLSTVFQDRKINREIGRIRSELERATGEIWRDYRRGIERLGSESSSREVYRILVRRILGWLGYEKLSRMPVLNDKDEVIDTDFYHYIEDGKRLLLFYFLPFEEDLDSGRARAYKKLKLALFSTGVRWGVLTNGRIFRLVKNEALGNAYLDINLRRAWEDGNREVFHLFTLLFHRRSLLPITQERSILETIEERCKEEAASVGKDLQVSVYAAVERLLREAYRRNPNVDLKKLFEETLIYMFRLLFLFYAESTELLPVDNEIYRLGYSVTALREFILTGSLRAGDDRYFIWDTLDATFRCINRGVDTTHLKIEPYNGGLFDPRQTQYLSKTKIPDSIMAEIIKDIALTRPRRGKTRDRVSFREMGISQIGAIYESLLELEPKVAEEDIAVVRKGNEEIFIPYSQLDQTTQPIRIIPKGEAYLSSWGGTRKSTGTYYTPKQITEFLVKSALEEQVKDKSPDEILDIKVVDPAMGSGAFLVAAVNFLGDAYYYAMVKENEEKKKELSEEEIEELRREERWFLDMDVEKGRRVARRRVLENCIYGVDLNPLAVDLAKVSLWLTAMEKNKPLTFLDHKLRPGNSLIGTTKERIIEYPKDVVNIPSLKERAKKNPALKKRLDSIKDLSKKMHDKLVFFSVPGVDMLANPLLSTIKDLVKYREGLMTPEEEIEDIRVKEDKWRRFVDGEIEEGRRYEKLKKIYDLWTALWFWEWGDLPDPLEYTLLVDKIINDKEMSDREKSIMERVQQLRDKYHFFHWELEFPEVFENGGFDAAVGNPPWNTLQPESDEFFSNYEPRFRSYKRKEKVKVMEKILDSNSVIRKQWKDYVTRVKNESFFFRTSNFYPHLLGKLDLYNMFLERFFWVIREGGRMSIIVPSGLYTDEGCKELRRMFLERSKISFLIGVENREKIFPAIDIRFKYSLFSTLKSSQGKDYKFRAGFFVGSRPKEKKKAILDAREILAGSFAPKAEELENLLPLVLEDGLKISRKLIERFSPDTLSIMEFKRQEDIDLAEKIYDDWPLLGEEIEGAWNVKFTQEFNMTSDAHLFITRRELLAAGAKPLDKRELRWVLEKDTVVDGRELKKGTYLPLYEGKMIWQFDAFYDKPKYWINKESGDEKLKGAKGEIHLHGLTNEGFYRMGYREIASNTNERTLIVSMVFKNVYANHKLPLSFEYKSNIKNKEKILLTAILNSICIDHILRPRATTSVGRFMLNALPIPRLTSGNWFFDQIVPRAARLICIDEEFAELWEETFRPEWREIARTSRVGGWENLSEKWTTECGAYGWIENNGEKRDDGDRAQLRAEIDALVAHLYGLTRDEFAYILDTFPVLRKKEIAAFGEYRTKRMCLEEYERFAGIISQIKRLNPEYIELGPYKKVHSGR